MRHGRRGRALNMDGHQSRPPHHKLSLPLASMRRGVAGTIKRLHVGHQRPPLPSHHQLPCGSMRSRASSRHMRMSHTGPNTHPPTHQRGEGVGRGERGTGERTCSEPRRPPAKGKSASTVCVPNKGAGDPVLTQVLEHGRRGPHTWALGDCCTLGRCPSTHTPHTTPHAHTLGQHIGYEEGHP